MLIRNYEPNYGGARADRRHHNISSKGQIVIPRKVRKKFGVKVQWLSKKVKKVYDTNVWISILKTKNKVTLPDAM